MCTLDWDDLVALGDLAPTLELLLPWLGLGR